MKTVNIKKVDLIKNLSVKKGFSVLLSKKLVEDFFFILKSNIKSHETNLKNLGTFKLISKKERMGRNPKTKQIFTISARKSLSFITSKNLLNKLNK